MRSSAILPLEKTADDPTVTSRLHEAGPAYIWQLLYDIVSPHRPTLRLFCTLCPQSRAPGKYFPVGHPSLNCSRASTLNFRVLSRWVSRKEVATCWYESPINPIKPWAGCYILTPLKRSRSSSINPKPGTSPLGHVRASSASACAMLYDHSGSTPAMHTMPAELRHTRP